MADVKDMPPSRHWDDGGHGVDVGGVRRQGLWALDGGESVRGCVGREQGIYHALAKCASPLQKR